MRLIALSVPCAEYRSIEIALVNCFERETPMFSSTRMTYDVSKARHQEHLDHAARIHEIRRDRQDAPPVNRSGHRLVTVARLAAASVASMFH
jgi:hypothetical protein